MRISVDVCGHLDWVPCPANTEITEADVNAGRVKKLSDDRWYMLIEKTGDTHHDVGIHEHSVCDRMAATLAIGKPQERDETIAELLRGSLKHHVRPKHIKKINVHDDGPNEETFKASIAKHPNSPPADGGVYISPEAAAAALVEYMQPIELEPYLNSIFVRARKAPEAK